MKEVKLQRIGNSKGVIIDSGVLKMLGITNNDKLGITLENNKIVIVKVVDKVVESV
jgi:antitoxin component of MazEF toxin-antitoxin module